MQSTLLKAGLKQMTSMCGFIHNFDSILLIENATTQLVGLTEKKKTDKQWESLLCKFEIRISRKQ